ncbi:unnamed protein product [Sphagnum compactum]
MLLLHLHCWTAIASVMHVECRGAAVSISTRYSCYCTWRSNNTRSSRVCETGIIGNFSSQWCSLLDQVLLLYHLSILQLSDSDYVVAVPDGKQCILQMSF